MKQLKILIIALIVLAASFAIIGNVLAAQSPQIRLPGSMIPQFIQPLPLLSVAGGTMATVLGNQPLTLTMCEFDANMLPPGTPLAAGATGTTRVWGYIVGNTCPSTPQDTYIGPVVVNERELFDTCNLISSTCTNHEDIDCSTDTDCRIPTSITFVNNLGSAATTQVLAWKYSTDQTLHWADPLNNGANMCNHMPMYPAYLDPCSINYGEVYDPNPNNPRTFTNAPIPAVPHLHGGEVPPDLDGGPDAWYTSDGAYHGHAYHTFAGAPANAATYKYPNTQEASPIWFHDHVLGITRLNVYAGLAGAYLIYDPMLNLPAGLHQYGLMNGADGAVEATVPVVIQDRTFDTNGQLFMQADTAGGILWATNPEHPYWTPEFVGDTIVVNGKAWPYLNVEPKRYRLWFINGSNARTYGMSLTDPVSKNSGPSLYVIATDGGYLDAPVRINPNAAKPALTSLVMMPGERYEVIVDFAGYGAGVIGPNGLPYSGAWMLKNNAKTPFPGGVSPQGATTGRIMQFVVGSCTSGLCGTADTSYNPALGGAIRTGNQTIQRLVNPATGTLAVNAQKTRQLTLNEVMGMPWTGTDPVTGLQAAYPGGPLEILVNNTKWSGESPRPYNDFTPITVNGNTTYYSELPQEGETEVWEIVNITADAHPIHLHLVQFQLINRQNFNTNKFVADYDASFPKVPGDPVCTGGVFCPGFGPPLSYDGSDPLSGGKLGGNPDVGAVKMTKKGTQPLYLQGMPIPPDPNEAGWKDTVIVYPGQVTRLAVRWAPTSEPANAAPATLYFPFDPSDGLQHGYVWHCHIIDHEDNEMMRPDLVMLNTNFPAASRPIVKGVDY
jgi:spore coat protein A